MAKSVLEFDRSFLSKEIPAGVYTITKEHVTQYHRLLGASGRSEGELKLPPVVVSLLHRRWGQPDIGLQFPHVARTQGGETLELLEPVYVGDTLTATSRLLDVYVKTGRSGAMAFQRWETVFTNQKGAKVATLVESFVFIQ